MNTLAEIETAADQLPLEEQEELLLFLAERLRGTKNKASVPRDIPKAQIEAWIADDEAGMQRFRAGQ